MNKSFIVRYFTGGPAELDDWFALCRHENDHCDNSPLSCGHPVCDHHRALVTRRLGSAKRACLHCSVALARQVTL